MKKFTLLLAIVAFTATLSQAQSNLLDLEGLVGLYEFADSDNLFENTATETGVGVVMCEGVMKFDPDAADPDFDDMPSTEFEDWEVIDGISDNAIALKAFNWFKMWHGIPANGGGDFVNDFAVVIDVRIADENGIYSLVEVNPTPTANGFTSEMEIEYLTVGSIGAPSSSSDPLGHSEEEVEIDVWYRIIYSAKLGESISIYVNGELWIQMFGNFTDARPAPYGADTDPADAAMKICGNNESAPANDPERDGDKDVDLVGIYNRTLTADEAAQLGAPGTVSGIKDIQKSSIRLYPNPANDILNISIEHASKLEIINASGQVVESTYLNDTKTSINVSHLKSGIYFVKVIDNAGNVGTQKLIIE